MLTREKREELEGKLKSAGLTEEKINLIALLGDKLHAATAQSASAGDCLQAAVALLGEAAVSPASVAQTAAKTTGK